MREKSATNTPASGPCRGPVMTSPPEYSSEYSSDTAVTGLVVDASGAPWCHSSDAASTGPLRALSTIDLNDSARHIRREVRHQKHRHLCDLFGSAHPTQACATSHSDLPVCRVDSLGATRPQQRGIDGARRHTVHPNLLGPQLARRGSGPVHQTSLRRRIRSEESIAPPTGRRCGHHNRSTLRLTQRRERRPCQ